MYHFVRNIYLYDVYSTHWYPTAYKAPESNVAVTISQGANCILGIQSIDIQHIDVQAPSKSAVVSLSKKLYPCCLVLVGSRNGFERDFTIELK